MEDPEVPTEHLHEHIHEAAHENHDKWSMRVAISTAFMAAFAALSSLMAGHQSNEALITQMKASDQWSYYNAKGIKAEVAMQLPRSIFQRQPTVPICSGTESKTERRPERDTGKGRRIGKGIEKNWERI